MKTPMQEVFAHLRASKENDSLGAVMTARLVGYAVDWLLENEKSLLEKEKEMVINAWNDGAYGGGQFTTTHDTSEQYFNETFNTKEK